jgi:preprotein translocase subunit YajC
MESFGGLLFPLLILLLFIPIFLSGRKQRRQMQTMQQLQSSLEAGDVVTTTSGLRGTVVDASYEETIDLEIADGVVTTWLRASVRDKVLDGAGDTAPAAGPDGAILDGADGSNDAALPATGTGLTRTETLPTETARSDSGRTEVGRTEDGRTEALPTETGGPAEPTSDANGSHRP